MKYLILFNEKFNATIPDDDPEYETLNGFLIKLIGKIPEIKEEINYGNWQFTIMKKTLRRVGQVKVRKLPPPPVVSEEDIP